MMYVHDYTDSNMACCLLLYVYLGRLLRVDLNKAGLKCPSVHSKFIRIQ